MFENFLKNECNIDVNEIVGNTEPGLENAKFSNGDNSLAEVDVAILGATGFSQELNQFIARASNLADGIQQVSEIEDVANAAQSEGGLTKREGQLIASQMNGLCGLLEMPSVDVPAMEHFGDASPRSVATEMVATEAAGTIKKWIDSLIAFVKKQFDALAKLWEKYTEAGQKLKRWAEASLPKIDKMGAIKEGSEKIKYPELLADKDGKALGSAGVIKGLNTLVTFLDKEVPDAVKMLDDSTSNIRDSEEGAALYKKVWSGIKSANPFKEKATDPKNPKMEISRGEVQLGNFRLTMFVPKEIPEERDAAIKALSTMSLRVKPMNVKKPEGDALKDVPLGAADMKSMVSDIKSVADGITQIKKDMEKSKKELNMVASTLKTKDEKSVRELAPLTQKIAASYTSGPGMAVQKSVVALRAVAGLIDTSIKAHKSE